MMTEHKRTEESPVDNWISGPRFKHVLISCAYSGEPVAVQEFTSAVEKMLEDHPVRIEAAVTYSSPYFGMPNNLALRDVWMNMPDADRQRLIEEFPQIAEAIKLLLIRQERTGRIRESYREFTKEDVKREVEALVRETPR